MKSDKHYATVQFLSYLKETRTQVEWFRHFIRTFPGVFWESLAETVDKTQNLLICVRILQEKPGKTPVEKDVRGALLSLLPFNSTGIVWRFSCL